MDTTNTTLQNTELASRCTVIIPAYRPDERL